MAEIGDLPDAWIEAAQAAVARAWPSTSEYVSDWHPADQELHRRPDWASFKERREAVLEQQQWRAARAALATVLPLIRAHIADDLRAYALPEWLVKGTVGIRMQREIVLDCADFVARRGSDG